MHVRARVCVDVFLCPVVARCKPSVELSWLRQSRATTGTAATGTSAHRRGTRAPCGGGTVEVEERTLLVKRQRCCTTFSSRGTSNTAATSLVVDRLALRTPRRSRKNSVSPFYPSNRAFLPDPNPTVFALIPSSLSLSLSSLPFYFSFLLLLFLLPLLSFFLPFHRFQTSILAKSRAINSCIVVTLRES